MTGTLPLNLDEVCLANEVSTPAQALRTALKRRFPNAGNPQEYLKKQLGLFAECNGLDRKSFLQLFD
ncbi:hypothetical protein CU042_07195 [Corynebacterium striatum]|nr:hypothetical protein [Corynebacterium striatum]